VKIYQQLGLSGAGSYSLSSGLCVASVLSSVFNSVQSVKNNVGVNDVVMYVDIRYMSRTD
jgi:hypothetical protein